MKLKIAGVTFLGLLMLGNVLAEDLAVENITDVPGKTKDQIYNGIKAYIGQNFVSGKEVIEQADKDIGRLIGNAIIKWPCRKKDWMCSSNWRLKFNFRVDVKDGKFRTTYSNLIFNYGEGNQYGFEERPVSEKELEDAKRWLANLTDDFRYAVEKEAESDKW